MLGFNARLQLSQVITDDKRLLEFVAVSHEVLAQGVSQFTGRRGSRNKFLFLYHAQQFYRRAIYNPFFPTINRFLFNAPTGCTAGQGTGGLCVEDWYTKFRRSLATLAGIDETTWKNVSVQLRRELLQHQIQLMDPYKELCLAAHKASMRPEGRACADFVCQRCYTIFPKLCHSGHSTEDLFIQHPCTVGEQRHLSDIILTNTGQYGDYINSEYIGKFHHDQKEAAQEICRGSNVMLFGPAGAGKTFVYQGMRHLKILQNGEENTVSTATLKIISQVNDGHTLHHIFLLPTESIKRYRLVCGNYEEKLRKATQHVHENEGWMERLFGTKGQRFQSSLFLDECSSLSANDFEFILCLLEVIFCSTKPFGGLQIILSGDPLQNVFIPLKRDEIQEVTKYGCRYDVTGELPFFTSMMFKKHFKMCLIFGKGHRFEGDEWYQILLRMRTNRNTEQDYSLLNELFGANGMTVNTEYMDCANAVAVHLAGQSVDMYKMKKNNGYLQSSRIDPVLQVYQAYLDSVGGETSFGISSFIQSQVNVRESTPNGIILTTETVQQEAYKAMEACLRVADLPYEHQSTDLYFIKKYNIADTGIPVQDENVTQVMKDAAEKVTMKKLQRKVTLTPGSILTINDNKAGYYLYNGMRVRVISYDATTHTLLVLPLDSTNRGRVYIPQVLPQLTMIYDFQAEGTSYRVQRTQFPLSYGSTLSVMAIAGLTFNDDCIYFDNTRCMLTSAFYQFCSRVRSPKQLWCRHPILRRGHNVRDGCGGWTDIRIDMLCRVFNDCCMMIKENTGCNVFHVYDIFACTEFIAQIDKELKAK